MKLGLFLSLPIALLLFTGSANAAVSGLPKQLKGSVEERIQNDAFDVIAETNECKTAIEDQKQASFKIIKSEKQSAEDAEYAGELSSFVLQVQLDLPAGVCKLSGSVTCEVRYDLYDERAYQVDAKSTSCQ